MSDSLREALEKIIAMNVQYAKDRYGDAAKAEEMACVMVARAALSAPQADAEPVRWQFQSSNGEWVTFKGKIDPDYFGKAGLRIRPLYTAPPSQPAETGMALEGMPAPYGEIIPVWEMIDRLEDRGAELNVNGVTPNGQLMLKAAYYIRCLSPRADEGTKSEGGAQPSTRRLDDLGSVQDGRKMSTDGHRADAGNTSDGERRPFERVTAGETAPSEPKPWPNGCRNPNSCAIHRDCMYVQCKHYTRDISGEVDAALQRGGQ